MVLDLVSVIIITLPGSIQVQLNRQHLWDNADRPNLHRFPFLNFKSGLQSGTLTMVMNMANS